MSELLLQSEPSEASEARPQEATAPPPWRLRWLGLSIGALALLATSLCRGEAEAAGAGHVIELSEEQGITLLQFNPHWECFKPQNVHQCGTSVFKLITSMLQRHQVDFANIVELPKSYKPPKGWVMNCREGGGGETTCLIWKADAWEIIGPATECWFGRGRACNVMTFVQLDSGMKLTIVGAHFPHGAETGWYGEYLGVLRYNVAMSRKVTEKVVLLADSNAGLHQKSDYSLLTAIGAALPHVRAPTMWYRYRTCCNNVGYHGFYDRIVSNFGSSLALIQDPEYSKESNGYQATPGYARINLPYSGTWGEYHQPVLARLNF